MTKFIKHHRRYDDRWEYRAISTEFNNGDVIGAEYRVEIDHRTKTKHAGINIFYKQQNGHNYSKHYNSMTKTKIDPKSKKIVNQLIKIHRQTKWSREKRVDLN